MFSVRLKELRKNSNLSQADLSNILNLKTKQTISDYENGRSEPNIEILIKISRFFNVPVDYILGLSDFKNSTDYMMFETKKEAVEKIDPHTKDFLANFIQSFYSLAENLSKSNKKDLLEKNKNLVWDILIFACYYNMIGKIDAELVISTINKIQTTLIDIYTIYIQEITSTKIEKSWINPIIE